MSRSPKNKAGTSILTRDGPADYIKLDADAFPVIQTEDIGAILEITDTGSRYKWTGTKWLQTHIKGLIIARDYLTEVSEALSLTRSQVSAEVG